jgi:hypothetical protein
MALLPGFKFCFSIPLPNPRSIRQARRARVDVPIHSAVSISGMLEAKTAHALLSARTHYAICLAEYRLKRELPLIFLGERLKGCIGDSLI